MPETTVTSRVDDAAATPEAKHSPLTTSAAATDRRPRTGLQLLVMLGAVFMSVLDGTS